MAQAMAVRTSRKASSNPYVNGDYILEYTVCERRGPGGSKAYVRRNNKSQYLSSDLHMANMTLCPCLWEKEGAYHPSSTATLSLPK